MRSVDALVIDTSSWIGYLRSTGPSAVAVALDRGVVRLPPIVLAEILSGRMRAPDRGRLRAILDPLPLCDASRDHWVRVGELRARLSGQGLSASLPDVHVAQCALDLDAPLLTEDAVFTIVARHTALRLAR
jgi:predicted nucleic acid-binding protein